MTQSDSGNPAQSRDAWSIIAGMRAEYWRSIEKAPETVSEEILELLNFKVGRESFAVEVTAVREVTLMPALISKIPRSSDYLLGVMNLRGQIVPIMDIGRLIGAGKSSARKTERVVILRGTKGDLGLLAWEVYGIALVKAGELGPPVKIETSLPAAFVRAQAPISGRTTVLLNSTALVSAETFWNA